MNERTMQSVIVLCIGGKFNVVVQPHFPKTKPIFFVFDLFVHFHECWRAHILVFCTSVWPFKKILNNRHVQMIAVA